MLGSLSEPEEGPCPRCCLIALVDTDRRRRCPASMPVDRRAGATPTWLDRGPLAGRLAHSGSAGARRSRSRSPARRAHRASWQGRTSPRSRHGCVGLGRTPAVAPVTCRPCPWALRSVSSTAGRVVISGRPPPLEASCAVQPSPQVSVDDSLHISCGRPRPRDGSRRRAPRRHSAAARPQQPRHHLGLLPRDRQRPRRRPSRGAALRPAVLHRMERSSGDRSGRCVRCRTSLPARRSLSA
jgi:hypothetical protein